MGTLVANFALRWIVFDTISYVVEITHSFLHWNCPNRTSWSNQRTISCFFCSSRAFFYFCDFWMDFWVISDSRVLLLRFIKFFSEVAGFVLPDLFPFKPGKRWSGTPCERHSPRRGEAQQTAQLARAQQKAQQAGQHLATQAGSQPSAGAGRSGQVGSQLGPRVGGQQEQQLSVCILFSAYANYFLLSWLN